MRKKCRKLRLAAVLMSACLAGTTFAEGTVYPVLAGEFTSEETIAGETSTTQTAAEEAVTENIVRKEAVTEDIFAEDAFTDDSSDPVFEITDGELPEENFEELTKEDTPMLTAPVYSGDCGHPGNEHDVTWALENGVMTIKGNGEISYYMNPDQDQPWAAVRNEVKEIIIEEGITYIGYSAFSRFANLEKITFPDSLTGINHNVFYGCRSLKNITLGKNVNYLGTCIFAYSGITSFTIPASLTDFSEDTFNYADEMTYIEADPNNPKYSSEDGILYSKDGKTLVYCPAAWKKSVCIIPKRVTELAPNAFFRSNISEVVLPAGLTKMGCTAFRECKKLTSLTFPKSLKKIPYWACYADDSLTSITIPEGVTSIDWEAFNRTGLEEVSIPKSVTYIGKHAFPDSTDLIFSPESQLEKQPDGSYVQVIALSVPVKRQYSQAFEVLSIVNKERAKAGAAPLKMDTELLSTAMLRAAESAIYWDHTRPNGTDCFTANSRMLGENIAIGSPTAASVMDGWMNSPGHRGNILSQRYSSIGIGSVVMDGVTYWVQCFGSDLAAQASSSSYKDGNKTYTVSVSTEDTYYNPIVILNKTPINVGEATTYSLQWNNTWRTVKLPIGDLTAASADTSICKTSGSKIIARAPGVTKISIYFPGYKAGAVKKTITVKAPKVTVKLNANGGTIKTKSKTVTYNSTYGTLAKPKRTGYTFKGWYTKKSGGTKVTSSTKVSKTTSHTLYAHWKKK